MLGVRPEHVRLGAADGADGVPARVRVVESLGHERLVLCHVDGVSGDVVVRTDAAGARPDTGELVRLHSAAADLHVFDADTTARIDP